MKKLIIITGFESTGSVFVAKVISYVTGKCQTYGSWSGYGVNGSVDDELVILHQSMPSSRRPKKWLSDLDGKISQYVGYQVYCVVCTRDLNISKQSRMSRFGGTLREYTEDDERASEYLISLLRAHNSFIFSFETAVALKNYYYHELFKWLDVETEFVPPLFDANAPYVKRRFFPKYYAVLRRLGLWLKKNIKY